MDRTRKSDLKKALIATLPVLTGYLVLGTGFGFLMRNAGYGTLWSAASALFVYAGSLQYASVELLRTGASLLTAAMTALAVNARMMFYSISMLERYRSTGSLKWYLAFTLTDESYSLLCDDRVLEDVNDRKFYYFAVSFLDQMYWFIGCIIGGALSSVLVVDTSGAEFALTALFVSVMTSQWMGSDDHLPAVTGVLCSVLSLLIFGKDDFLIPAMILIVISLMAERRVVHEA